MLNPKGKRRNLLPFSANRKTEKLAKMGSALPPLSTSTVTGRPPGLDRNLSLDPKS